MRRTSIATGVAMIGLLCGACADGADEDLDMGMDEPMPTTEPVTEPVTQPPGLESMAAALSVEELPDGDSYLTDADGRALYLLEGEPEGQSTCYDACAEEWPPYLAEDAGVMGASGATDDTDAAGATDEEPMGGTADTDAGDMAGADGEDTMGTGDQLEPDRIGTLQRTDGSTQLTYDGHALYYYHDDQGMGQTQGQEVTDQWGEWYLVTPEGEPLEGEIAASGGS